MQLIDTHTHLDFEMFDDDRAQVIARARNAGVERIVVLGVHAANWQRVWQLACDEPSVHAALGLHPVFLESTRTPTCSSCATGWSVCAASLSSAPSARSAWITTSTTRTSSASNGCSRRSWRWRPISPAGAAACAAPMRR